VKFDAVTHIRIRRNTDGAWRWELVMSDGHVVQQSEWFADRTLCEAEAKQQELPIAGLSRAASRGSES
jgi:uncharacterized protein YegP (UPF0339 family)